MRVHLIGIGGAAMSALANVYLARGDSVSGSDLESTEATRALAEAGADVRRGHSDVNMGRRLDLVVTSTAIPDGNPELAAARRRGLRVVHRRQAAAELVADRRQVVVAGTHGKTTTTTFCAAVLAGLDPLVLSGGRLPGSDFNSRPGAGPVAVIEGDESDRSFLALTPEITVVTNVEADHLDHFRDLDEIVETFSRLATATAGTLVAGVDDAGALRVLSAAPGETLTYGFTASDVRAYDLKTSPEGSEFLAETPWGAADISLTMPGRHNVLNALAAVAVGGLLGVPLRQIAASLAAAALPGRRLELVATVGGARVYDDYGHHPTEIVATLRAARQLQPTRLICAFQPHRFTRLAALLPDFARAFTRADEVLLLPVYAAGEEPIAGVDSAALAAAIEAADPDRPVTLLRDLEQLAPVLRDRLGPGDVAVCMGAGDIYKGTRAIATEPGVATLGAALSAAARRQTEAPAEPIHDGGDGTGPEAREDDAAAGTHREDDAGAGTRRGGDDPEPAAPADDAGERQP